MYTSSDRLVNLLPVAEEEDMCVCVEGKGEREKERRERERERERGECVWLVVLPMRRRE